MTTLLWCFTSVKMMLGNFKNISNNLDYQETKGCNMGKNFSALKAALPAKSQSKVTKKTEQMLQEIPLHELRQAGYLALNNIGKNTAYSATRRRKN
ncbi:MAG TPA: hypothetical protein VGE32_12785 [Cellvibrio sp.]